MIRVLNRRKDGLKKYKMIAKSHEILCTAFRDFIVKEVSKNTSFFRLFMI